LNVNLVAVATETHHYFSALANCAQRSDVLLCLGAAMTIRDFAAIETQGLARNGKFESRRGRAVALAHPSADGNGELVSDFDGGGGQRLLA
jgi:hypothetical protein